jgi:hypothetical protein
MAGEAGFHKLSARFLWEHPMAKFTPTQGRYLAFIHAYFQRHGIPPAESDIAAALCVSPPSVNQMVRTLEKKGLVLRHPGQARSLQLLVPSEEIPPWNHRAAAKTRAELPAKRAVETPPCAAPPANLYVLSVYLLSGPISGKSIGKQVLRVIEIRGDQTLQQLHEAIFQAFDRYSEHLYEFQFGKRPHDPAGPNYGVPETGGEGGDARTATLDGLKLKVERAFGYWFDFGDDWMHQVQVDRIEQAIPTVTYPRVVKRVGKSPPQYPNSESMRTRK